MKNVIKILVLSSLSFGACDSFLDKEPIGLITQDQINTEPTESSVTSSVNSSYQVLSNTLNIIGEWNWLGGTVLRDDFIIYDIASGDMEKKWNPDGDQAWMDQVASFNFTSLNGAFNGTWTYDYEGIARCNQAIALLEQENLAAQTGMSPALQDRLLGEVYFLRAYYYFELTNNFGDVPLLTKPLENFEQAYEVAGRVSKSLVVEQIKADLESAAVLLPTAKYSSEAEPWRVSLGAVKALQAKIALFEEDWTMVLQYIAEIESLGFYALNPHYFDAFEVSKEYKEQEVIFAYNHEQGLNPKKGNGLGALMGWGFVAPSEDFLAAFEQGDPRSGYTVNPERQLIHKLLGSTDGEYKGNDDSPGNKIYIRYADVLLWKAEAYLQQGDINQGLLLIDQIRARARNTPALSGLPSTGAILPPLSNKGLRMEEAIAALRQERRVELGFESQRFNDLKRWGIAKSSLTALGKNFQDYHMLYPVPQGEIDKSGGRIGQNPGY